MTKIKNQKKPLKMYVYALSVVFFLLCLIVWITYPQNQLIFSPLKDSQYMGKLPVEVIKQKDTLFATNLKSKAGEYLITKKINQGSGGGAYYNVYKLENNAFISVYLQEAYSCKDPLLVKNGKSLFFENFGSHCDWFDTGSGSGEKIEISLE